MSAYEYMDLAYSAWMASIAIVSLWIAVLSGYLVVAYTVGANLTRIQVSVLNIAYSIWALYLLFSGVIYLVRARSHLLAAAELVEVEPPLRFMLHGYASMGILLWLASLWFMWSIRRTKK